VAKEYHKETYKHQENRSENLAKARHTGFAVSCNCCVYWEDMYINTHTVNAYMCTYVSNYICYTHTYVKKPEVLLLLRSIAGAVGCILEHT